MKECCGFQIWFKNQNPLVSHLVEHFTFFLPTWPREIIIGSQIILLSAKKIPLIYW